MFHPPSLYSLISTHFTENSLFSEFVKVRRKHEYGGFQKSKPIQTAKKVSFVIAFGPKVPITRKTGLMTEFQFNPYHPNFKLLIVV